MKNNIMLTVIGLDGLDPSMIHYFRGFSVHARLDPNVPLTYPSWGSIETGLPPTIHGLLDFVNYVYKEDGKLIGFTLASANDLKVPRVFEALALRGRKVLVVNPVPVNPLPRLRNLISISAAHFGSEGIWPQNFTNIFKSTIDLKTVDEFYSSRDCSKLVDLGTKIVEMIDKLVEKILKIQREIHFLWVNINLPDSILHRCPDMLRQSPKLIGLLKTLNNFVTKFKEYSENLVIVSDHGFKLYRKTVNINAWLKEKGYAIPGGGGLYSIENGYVIRKKRPRLISSRGFLRTVLLLRRSKTLRRVLRGLMLRLGLRFTLHPAIDVEKSKAFMPVVAWSMQPLRFYIWVNDVNVRDQLISDMDELRELYGIAPAELEPKTNMLHYHLVGLRVEGDYLPVPGSTASPVVENVEIAHHAQYGVIAGWGAVTDKLKDLDMNILPAICVTPLLLNVMREPLYVEHVKYGFKCSYLDNPATFNYTRLWRALRKVMYQQ